MRKNELCSNGTWIKNQYINLGKSSYQISKEFGIDKTVICRWLNRHNIKIRIRKTPVTKCAYCGKKLKRIASRLRKKNYCNSSHQLKYEYENGVRNPKTIARQAHEKMRKKAQQGMHPFQRKDVRDKIRQSQQTPEYKLKTSLAKFGSKNGMYGVIGKDHPQWKGGKIWWRGKDWDELKLEIRKRDNFKCQGCGLVEEGHLERYNQPLCVHHIIDYRESKDNDPNNLITLCLSCHGHAHTEKSRKLFILYKDKFPEKFALIPAP